MLFIYETMLTNHANLIKKTSYELNVNEIYFLNDNKL